MTPSVTTYTYPPRTRQITRLLAPLVFLFALVPFVTLTKDGLYILVGFYALCAVPSLGLFTWWLLTLGRYKIVLSGETIEANYVANRVYCRLDELKGFRAPANRQLILETGDPKHKIVIYSGTHGYDELRRMICARLPNLDQLDQEEYARKLMANRLYGNRPEQRRYNLLSLQKLSWLLNILAILLFAWCAFWPYPRELCFTVTALLPLAAFALVFLTRGKIQIFTLFNNPQPSLVFVFIFCPAIALLKGFGTFNLLAYSPLVIAAAVILVLLLVPVYLAERLRDPANTKEKGGNFILLVFYIMYAPALALLGNCLYDTSETDVSHVSVLDKHTSTGKYTSYYIHVTAWHNREDNNRISINRRLYKSVVKGDEIKITMRKGLLGIPWYELRSMW